MSSNNKPRKNAYLDRKTINRARQLATADPGPDRNVAKACQLLLPLAEQGNRAAQLALAEAYHENDAPGSKPKLVSARWLEAAATAYGDASIMNRVGNAYFSIAMSGTRYRNFASKGQLNPIVRLWRHLSQLIYRFTCVIGLNRSRPRYFVEAKQWHIKAAAKGDAAAKTTLGDYAFMGVAKEPKNLETAFEKYQKGADAGNLSAVANLGIMLCEGWGCPPDKQKGVNLLKKAEEVSVAHVVLHFFYDKNKSDPAIAIAKYHRIRGEGYYPPFNRLIFSRVIHPEMIIPLLILIAIPSGLVWLIWFAIKSLYTLIIN